MRTRPRGDKKRPKAPLAAGSQAVSLSFLACDGKHETAENPPLGKAFWIDAGLHRISCKGAGVAGRNAPDDQTQLPCPASEPARLNGRSARPLDRQGNRNTGGSYGRSWCGLLRSLYFPPHALRGGLLTGFSASGAGVGAETALPFSAANCRASTKVGSFSSCAG